MSENMGVYITENNGCDFLSTPYSLINSVEWDQAIFFIVFFCWLISFLCFIISQTHQSNKTFYIEKYTTYIFSFEYLSIEQWSVSDMQIGIIDV